MSDQDLDSSVFASLAPGRRCWAVGAVHAERDRLVALHQNLAQRLRPSDHLIYLGNLLGRGPDGFGAVQEVLLFRRSQMALRLGPDAGEIVFLRGSQEEMWDKLLQMQFAPSPRQVLEWMLCQGVGATLEAYGGKVSDARIAANGGPLAISRWTSHLRATVRAADGHQQLMSALRRAAFTEDKALLFVHAGIDPARPLSQQGDSFWWNGDGFDGLNSRYEDFHRVVRGFDPRQGGARTSAVSTCLDGGCGYGGTLIAGCFDPAGALIDLIDG